MNRRSFIRISGLSSAYILSGIPSRFEGIFSPDFQSNRPSPEKRNFISKAVEEQIGKVQSAISNNELRWMFGNCYPNTLDTTVRYSEKEGIPDTFVITGDIPAMWLRDSSAQVWPYLHVADKDEKLQRLIAGVINRQAKCILIDPYANAFNDGPGESPWKDDITEMKPELHERKWEIDSLCYPIRLSYGYWRKTHDTSCFGEEWKSAMKLILKTFKEQQRKESKGPYKFIRVTGWQTDTLAGGGYGNPIRPVGLICSMFRPSDDATIFPFLIPSNLFAVISLRQVAELWNELEYEKTFAAECIALADEVEQAVKQYGIVPHPKFGNIYAYEVDGFGNRLFMDDANIPSLLSLPYLNICPPEDPVYINTRKFLLSEYNPYYFSGSAGKGIGGPHAGMDMIWPLSIIMQALTSTSDEEKVECIRMLIKTHAGTGFIHESFHKDNPEKFTRKWFAWANTLFGELIIRIYEENRNLLRKI